MFHHISRATIYTAIGVFIATVIVISLTLTQKQQHLTGTNNVALLQPALTLQPQEKGCQDTQSVPAGTGAIRFFASHSNSTRLEASLQTPHHALDTGVATLNSPSTPNYQAMVFTLHQPINAPQYSKICIKNISSGNTNIFGTSAPDSKDHKHQSGTITLEYLQPEKKSWLSLASIMAQRFTFGKAGFIGTWTFWLVIVLMSLVWFGSLAIVLRSSKQ